MVDTLNFMSSCNRREALINLQQQLKNMSQGTNRLRAYVLKAGRWLHPITCLFSWWRPFRYRQCAIVVLPDSMAIFIVAMGGLLFVPYMGWKYVLAYCLILLLSPFVLLSVLLIQGLEVKVVRLFALVPYWIHRVRAEARFDLYEAWEDPAPSGIAFEWHASDPLLLGTAASAEPLYRHISQVLEEAGWKHGGLGWERP